MLRSIAGKSSLNLHFRQLLAVFLTSFDSSAILSAAQPKNMKPSLIYGGLSHKTHIQFIRKFYLLGFQNVFVLGLLLTTTLKCKLYIPPIPRVPILVTLLFYLPIGLLPSSTLDSFFIYYNCLLSVSSHQNMNPMRAGLLFCVPTVQHIRTWHIAVIK